MNTPRLGDFPKRVTISQVADELETLPDEIADIVDASTGMGEKWMEEWGDEYREFRRDLVAQLGDLRDSLVVRLAGRAE